MLTLKTFTRRTGIKTLAAAALLATGMGAAVAQDGYPNKPLTMVVPFSAGGTTDILARIVGQALGQDLGQTIIIENKPGAGGNIGAQQAARAKADGYTLFMGTVGTHAINQALYKKLPYDPIKDFTPLSRVANVPNLLVVHPSRPYKTVKEMIEYGKKHPNDITFGSPGSGASPHVSGALFQSMTGVELTHVPYKGSAPSVVSLVSGETDFGFLTAVTINAQLKAGNLRALAVAHDSRLPAMPDVPTMDEAGLKGFTADAWFMAAVPAGTPQPIIDRLYQEIAKILPQEDVKAKLDAVGVLPAGLSPKASSEFLAKEIVKWREVVKTAKITLD